MSKPRAAPIGAVFYWVARGELFWYNTGDGRVAEWLKAHAWKACKGANLFAGSNPVPSAKP